MPSTFPCDVCDGGCACASSVQVPQHRAKLLGVQQTIITAAFVAGPAIGGWLATMYGPQVAFMLVGSLTGLCSFGYSLLPETLKNKRPMFGRAKPNNGAAAVATGSDGKAATSGGVAGDNDDDDDDGVAWGTLLRDPNQQVRQRSGGAGGWRANHCTSS